MKLEEKKKEKYNPDNIFSNHYKSLSIDNTENKQELSQERRLILWLIKHKMIFAVNILAKIRYRQKIW